MNSNHEEHIREHINIDPSIMAYVTSMDAYSENPFKRFLQWLGLMKKEKLITTKEYMERCQRHISDHARINNETNQD